MPTGRDLRMLMHTPMLLFQITNRIRTTATAFDGFTIYREDAGSYHGLAAAKGRSFDLTSLIPGESHQYWVKSWIRFENRESIWSEESEASNAVELTA